MKMNHLEGFGNGVPHGWWSEDGDEHTEVDREALTSRPPLGLKLRKTQSVLESIDKALAEQDAAVEPPKNLLNKNGVLEKQNILANDSRGTCQKMKSSSFFITKLKIGDWEITAKNESDIVGKFYYSKKKILWEILVDGLKKKLEIQWSQILSIKASFIQAQPCILQVELKTPPQLFKEHDPIPRKHTTWEGTNDFTEGQSTTYRRHYVELPEGTFEKHYEKLVNHDVQMLELSNNPFPMSTSPYFESFHDNNPILPSLQNNESLNYYPPQLITQYLGDFGSSSSYLGHLNPHNTVINYPTFELGRQSAFNFQGMNANPAVDHSTSTFGINMPQIIQEAPLHVNDDGGLVEHGTQLHGENLMKFLRSCFFDDELVANDDDQHVAPDSSNIFEPAKDDGGLYAIVKQRLGNSSRR